MTITPKALYTGGTMTNAAATYYTSPANTVSVITNATFTNIDSVARLLTVYVIRSGGTATNADILINAYSMATGTSYVSPEMQGQTLGAGDFIQMKADANSAITCAGINGFQIA